MKLYIFIIGYNLMLRQYLSPLPEVPSGCQSFHLGKAVVFQASFRTVPVYVKSKSKYKFHQILCLQRIISVLAPVTGENGSSVVHETSFQSGCDISPNPLLSILFKQTSHSAYFGPWRRGVGMMDRTSRNDN
jgi:hypothetical protein